MTCHGASAQVDAPPHLAVSGAQAAMERKVEIAFTKQLLTGPREAVRVTVEACILTIEFADQVACTATDGDQVQATRTILDLRETEPGPMTPLRRSSVLDGFLSGFRLGEALNNAVIEISDHYPSFHVVEESGNTVIDQARLSAWTKELLDARGVVSRDLKLTCKGGLFTRNLLGFEQLFALQASTGVEFSRTVDEYKSTFCEQGG